MFAPAEKGCWAAPTADETASPSKTKPLETAASMVVVEDGVGPEHESTRTTPYGLGGEAAIGGVLAQSAALGVRTAYPARIPRMIRLER